MFQDTAYYISFTLGAVVFAVGVGGNVAWWLSGSGQGDSRWARAFSLLRRAVPLIFRRRTLGAILVYGLVQRQLWRESRLGWLMSVSFLWGVIVLFFIGSLTDMLDYYGLVELSKDMGWFALVNELGGLLILLGVVIALYRRSVQRVPHLRSGREAWLVLAWLAAIALTGYLVEAARLLYEGVPEGAARLSFVGYGISRLGPSWDAAYRQIWWLHWVLAISLLAYIPYSKLFHALVTPLSILASSLEERMVPPGGGHHGVA